MTQEEKKLLLKDLSGRLPYGVKITCFKNGALTPYLIDFRDSTIHTTSDFSGTYIKVQLEDCKIYLRPMSSITDEEINEFILISDTVLWLGNKMSTCILSLEQMDWLNKNMFDYRGLIEKGLALEAPEGMYKTE